MVCLRIASQTFSQVDFALDLKVSVVYVFHDFSVVVGVCVDTVP